MTRKTRLWEGVKSLLIVLLSLSALYLLSRSPLVLNSGLTSLLGDTGASSSAPSSGLTNLPTAAIPGRIAVGSEKGLYGVQYDQSAADELFDLTASLLGEALRLAQAPTAISERQWQARLSGECIYFDYTCPIPLSTLHAWLDGTEPSTVPPGSARFIMLAREKNGTLSLCYCPEEAGIFYTCPTTLEADLHLAPILGSVSPNGAFFAFENKSLPDIIAPYTLLTGGEQSAAVYTSVTPTLLSDGSQTDTLLAALSFSDQNRANVSEGVLYVDGEDTLRLSGDGHIAYASSDSGKYPADPGLSGAVEAAWPLAEKTLGALCGQARLYLISAQESEEGEYTVTFGYMLDGCVVRLYDQGWAARFRVSRGSIQEFSLWLRTYTASGQSQLLLPAEKAAAALTALTHTTKELVIQYEDVGGTAQPGWKAR